MAGSGISTQTKKALVDLGLDEKPGGTSAPKAAPKGGDVTKQVTQSEYNKKASTQKARADKKYQAYKQRKPT